MNKPYKIIKVGGNEFSKSEYIQTLSSTVESLQKEHACILIHGGGRSIDEMMEKMQLEPQYKNGQRITDEATLEVVEMVLSGNINKRLIFALIAEGVEAIGLSGVDRKLLQVEPWGAEMNLVGQIVHVRQELLAEYCAQNVVPVISPVSIGPAGKFNVNADHAAGKIAGALKAEEANFITNLPGVLIGNEVANLLSDTQVQELIQNGTINGGMIPKVNAALDALKYGAKSAKITNLEGFTHGTGTTIIAERKTNGHQS